MTSIDSGEYKRLVLITLAAAVQKARVGLEHVASGQVQGLLELGVALDAIDMMAGDIRNCLEGISDVRGSDN